ncbi:MAG: amidohydrolase [Leptospiraceae bacterium]|nr:amidohydrolase [Leptospiraceae bacterium]MCP5513759.1 amidohydrolase [Leptospiraceae bacterium]
MSTKEDLVKFRRLIHRNPEIMFQEIQTSNLVEQHLKSLGMSYESQIVKTGILSLFDSGKPGKTILVRADMDALPIHEENDVEYKSNNPGVMHACGHDGHTAILMSLASELKKDPNFVPSGRVLLVFQPAEEGGGGGDQMVATGILDKYSVDAVFALHVWNHIDVGNVGVVDGTMMASVDEFEIQVKGKSGHGAMPQYTVDPIYVSAQIINSLQSIVSRNTDPMEPAVVTVGSIHAGEAFNVIPEICVMKGTIRTFSKKVYESIPNQFQNLVRGIAGALGAEVEIIYDRVNKPTINSPQMAEIVRRASENILGKDSVTEEGARTMGGEDFSAFLNARPGCYFFIGSRNEKKGFVKPHHNSRFDFDEDALKNGLDVMKEVIRLFLSN